MGTPAAILLSVLLIRCPKGMSRIDAAAVSRKSVVIRDTRSVDLVNFRNSEFSKISDSRIPRPRKCPVKGPYTGHLKSGQFATLSDKIHAQVSAALRRGELSNSLECWKNIPTLNYSLPIAIRIIVESMTTRLSPTLRRLAFRLKNPENGLLIRLRQISLPAWEGTRLNF